MSYSRLRSVPSHQPTGRLRRTLLNAPIGELSGGVSLAGTIDIQSSIVGALSVSRNLVSSIDPVSTINGAASVAQSLAGQLDLVSTINGVLTTQGAADAPPPIILKAIKAHQPKPLQARSVLISGLEPVSGAIALAGVIDGVSTIDAQLSMARLLTGQLDLVSTINGALSATKPIAGTLDIVCTINGALDVASAGVTVPVVLKAKARPSLKRIPIRQSFFYGELAIGTGEQALAGTIDAVSTINGVLNASKPLAGTINPIGTINGILSGTKPVAGAIDAVSTINGAISSTKPLVGNLDAVCTINGVLSLQGQVVIAGTLDAAVQIDGQLTMLQSLAGTITPAFTISGESATPRVLIGDLALLTSITGTLGISKGCQGVIVTTADINGAMRCAWALQSSCDIAATLSGSLTVHGLVGEPYRVLAVTERGMVFEATTRTFTFDFTKEG